MKNHALPLEDLLFRHRERFGVVQVPARPAELLLFVLRKLLEHGSVLEHLWIRREYGGIRRELAWLCAPGVEAESARLLGEWLPAVDAGVFAEGLRALKSLSSPLRLYRLGRRLHRILRPHALRPAGRVAFDRGRRTLSAFLRKYLVGRRSLRLEGGGAVIAFVGGEASGKSTLLADATDWLNPHFELRRAHAGKPPSTVLTFLPNLVKPWLRRAMPRSRTNTVEITLGKADFVPPPDDPRRSIPYLLRSFMIAYDQMALLRRARRWAGRGAVVLCDRYPSALPGGMDGPRADPSWFSPGVSIRGLLAGLERRIYAGIPKPDLVLFLSVPVEVALRRNAVRVKEDGTEPDAYVILRHALMSRWGIPGARVCRVDTHRPLPDVRLFVRRMIWDALRRPADAPPADRVGTPAGPAG